MSRHKLCYSARAHSPKAATSYDLRHQSQVKESSHLFSDKQDKQVIGFKTMVDSADIKRPEK
jgi:hypothetical protein